MSTIEHDEELRRDPRWITRLTLQRPWKQEQVEIIKHGTGKVTYLRIAAGPPGKEEHLIAFSAVEARRLRDWLVEHFPDPAPPRRVRLRRRVKSTA